MPMIDVHMPEDALSQDALDSLSSDLMRTLLRAERVDEAVADRKSLSWVFFHELPARRMYAGAKRIEGRRPVFRLEIGIPDGVLDLEHKKQFVAEATRLLLAAAGDDPEDPVARAHVWVLFREVEEGSWGAAGRIFTLADIGRAVGASDERIAAAASR